MRAEAPEDDDGGRLDKWLFCARFFRTRAQAAEAVSGGAVRRNGAVCLKPGQALRAGDVLTIRRPGGVAVVRARAFAARRGGPADAALLYEDIEGQTAADGRDGDHSR